MEGSASGQVTSMASIITSFSNSLVPMTFVTSAAFVTSVASLAYVASVASAASAASVTSAHIFPNHPSKSLTLSGNPL